MRLLLAFSAVVAVTVAEGCTEAVNAYNYEVNAIYNKPPKNGKFASGTTVWLRCKARGFFVYWGSDEATCVNGKWIPKGDTKLGRCPYMCRLSQLREKGYQAMWVDGAGKGQEYFRHGTKAYAFCDKNVSDMPVIEPPNMMCIDGKWIQSRGKGHCFGRS